ncbi:MAG TPA: alanine--tRNA ligase [Acidobacteriota bacterium]|nr:alanine--tRNA ligase [Acidobacteriota bacterium]
MTGSNQIRDSFLRYFGRNDHKTVSGSSLIPFNDQTLLFTNAGMNQFKNVFLGNETRPYKRAATSQKCMRVSGKHNDFRDVGRTRRHHTFFEMLGNFSFGDYFKKDAIHFAWELLTKEFGLDPGRLWVTVFREDDSAWDIWHNQEAIPENRIIRLDEADNFWAMGETGPCGPCSELHYDFGKSPAIGHGECDLTCSCGRWVEVWNLVFMQYNRDASGALDPLPSPSIDTGMGLERITAILQGKTSNYDTDLFTPLLEELSGMCGSYYGADANDDISMRIIADHTRAATFVIGDGQYPGNDKRGYVLRKIMRRAMVHGKRLGIAEPFIYRLAGTVVEQMAAAYPELVSSRETVARVIKQEEDSFAGTLDEGLKDFNELAKKLKKAGARTLSGNDAFFLYDTRGLPLEIIEDLAAENGLVVDAAGFSSAYETQRARSRKDHRSGKVSEEFSRTLIEGETLFIGYETEGTAKATVRAILLEGESADVIEAGQSGELVLDATPFYAESGGQAGDSGRLLKGKCRAGVINTMYRGAAITHRVEMETGAFHVGDEIETAVDMEKRRLTMKNHTATHLLQAALKQTLGSHVKQAGSFVAADRLRFDFTHYASLSGAEIRKIEDLVNEQIWRNIPLETTVMDLDRAMQSGAVSLFGEKYQENVRVVEVPGFSKELCGGTHVQATGAIGLFKIIGESGISAGIRRIEAVTGPAALERFCSAEMILQAIQEENRVPRQDIPAMIEKLHGQVRELQRQSQDLQAKAVRSNIGDIMRRTREINGTMVIAAALPETDRGNLRNLADEVKQKLGSGIVILGAPQGEKAALVVMVTPDISKKIPAGAIIRRIAPLVGGSGGGKPELAEAGGKDVSKLSDAVERSYHLVKELMEE